MITRKKLSNQFSEDFLVLEWLVIIVSGVSAASICAKVARDKCLRDWIFVEKQEGLEMTKEWGSGYPGDAVTKKFLRDNFDSFFGFPSIVRFSWKTAETILDEKGVRVEFEEIEPEEDPAVAKNPSIKQFFSQSINMNGKVGKENSNPRSGRCKFAKDRNIDGMTMSGFLNKKWFLKSSSGHVTVKKS